MRQKGYPSRWPGIALSQSKRYGGVLRLRGEIECNPVDTVAKAGRGRAVLEHMTQAAAAPRAVHLSAFHAVAAIDGGANRAVHRREKAGPARSAFELPLGHEQLVAAAGAREGAGPVFLQQCAGAGTLGGMFAQHGVLLRSERPAPLVLRLHHGKGFVLHGTAIIIA